MTNAELIAEIRKLAAELGTPETLPGLTKLRKPALEQLLSGLQLNLQARNEDESVNEEIDGGDVATRWLALNPSLQTETPEQMAERLAQVPSPQRDYQTSQEALVALGAFVAETDEAIADEERDFALGDVPELEHDATSDAELAEFLEHVVASDPVPTAATRLERITETDVRGLDGTGLVALVQFGSKLVWGKLIAIVNRRTKYAAPLLATIEIGGVRRLLNADDVLIGDSFVAAA